MLRLLPVLLLTACSCHAEPRPVRPVPPESAAALLRLSAAMIPMLTVTGRPACVAVAVTGGLLEAAAAGVEAGGGVIPTYRHDVSACGTHEPVSMDPEQVGTLIGAGLTLASVAASQARDCVTREWLSASIAHARGAAPLILAELAEPTGSITIPGVAVDLGGCL